MSKIVRYNNDMNSFNNLFDEFFNKNISSMVGNDMTITTPAVNIISNNDNYVLELAAPGLNKSDFSITIEKDNLIISAEVTEEGIENNDVSYTKREFRYNSFNRSFRLSDDVDRSNISAVYENGVLRLAVTKLPEEVINNVMKIEIG